jgi:alpha-tubulin suppressor-like RCC1 family protein
MSFSFALRRSALAAACALAAAWSAAACDREFPEPATSPEAGADACGDACSVQVEAGVYENQVVTGERFTCARTREGQVKCWGANSVHQLGIDSDEPQVRVPTLVPGLSEVVELRAGSLHACARTRSGKVYCWGTNNHGQLAHEGVYNDRVPFEVPGITDAVAIATGGWHTCIAHAGGDITCFGQIDIAPGAGKPSPTAILRLRFSLGEVERLYAGYTHTCAKRKDGTTWCWGAAPDGGRGEIGARTSEWHVPARVPVLDRARAVSLGREHTCFVESGGGVRCIGSNNTGQLGPAPDNNVHSAPVTPHPNGAHSIAAGFKASCSTRAAFETICWGNPYGAPKRIAALDGMRDIAIAYEHLCGITLNGEVACHGANDWGQIGDGTNDPATTARVVLH